MTTISSSVHFFLNLAKAQAMGKDIKSADFAGKQPTVLFFYVGAFTNT